MLRCTAPTFFFLPDGLSFEILGGCGIFCDGALSAYASRRLTQILCQYMACVPRESRVPCSPFVGFSSIQAFPSRPAHIETQKNISGRSQMLPEQRASSLEMGTMSSAKGDSSDRWHSDLRPISWERRPQQSSSGGGSSGMRGIYRKKVRAPPYERVSSIGRAPTTWACAIRH